VLPDNARGPRPPGRVRCRMGRRAGHLPVHQGRGSEERRMSETSKQAYLEALRRELASLPAAEADKSVAFIEEMIDDRMEDGATEAEAVAALGSPAEVARSIAAELPPIPGAVAKLKTGSRVANWVLAVVLSPLWVPLAAAAALTAASVY